VRRKIFIAFAGAAAALAVLAFVLDRNRDGSESVVHPDAAELPTHEIAGEPGDPLVVFIQADAGGLDVWDDTEGAVRDAGFRTLRFELPPPGTSDGESSDRFVVALERLLGRVEPASDRVLLVGASRGAIVAAEFAQRHPERIDKVALIGPSGFTEGAVPASYSVLGRTPTPVLLGWGTKDEVDPYVEHERAQQLLPQAEFFAIEDAGHLPMRRHPTVVLSRLIPFLMRGIAKGHDDPDQH
jgi:pimeloyl-ACP methyl ester carboxylesterase